MKSIKKTKASWVAGAILIWLLLVAAAMSANFLIDPYLVFEGDGFSGNRVGNLRFGKINWLNKNYEKYDAFIFGSSRTATYDPEYIEQYDANHHYYNLWVQMSTPDDQLKHLEYMLDRGWRIKKLLIQYDLGPEFFVDPSLSLCRIHPYVVGSSMFLEYLRYLVIFPRKDWRLVLKLKEKPLMLTHNLETGFLLNHELEEKVSKNTDKYIDSINDFHKKPTRSQLTRLDIVDKKIAAMEKIRSLAKQNDIQITVFITPHHWAYMDALNKEAWLYELEKLAAVTPVYNFASYNTVTLSNANYYEYSHYRPHITKRVIEELYGRQSEKSDFGVLLHEKNIRDYLLKLGENIDWRDANKND